MKTLFIPLIVISVMFAGIDTEYNLVSSVNPDLDIMELVNNTPELNTRDEGVVAFYESHEDGQIPAGLPYTVISLDIYNNIETYIQNMKFYADGSIGSSSFYAEILGYDGEPITPMVSSYHLTDDSGWSQVMFFNEQTAFYLMPDEANSISLRIYTENLGGTEGQFFFIPEEWDYNPEVTYLWPNDEIIYGANLAVIPESGENSVYVEFLGPEPNVYGYGTNDVTFMEFSITAGTNSELQSLRVELHEWSTDLDTSSLSCTEGIYNIHIVDTDNGESTASVDCSDFMNINNDDNGVYYDFTDSFDFYTSQTRNFAIIMDLGNNSVGGYYSVLGSTGQWYTSPETPYSISPLNGMLNTDTNEWITDITPSTYTQGNHMTVVASSLGVALASNPAEVNVVQGLTNINLGEIAFNAGPGSDMTISSLTLYGYIGIDPINCMVRRQGTGDGEYVYISDMVSNLRLYDITVDPNMTTNLNETIEAFSSTTGAASFNDMNMIIPVNETHIMKVVGDIAHNAYSITFPGNKYIKVNIATIYDLIIVDSNGNNVTLTDNDGTSWSITDVNGSSSSFNNSYRLKITNAGTLNVTGWDQPVTTNIIAGTYDVPMLNLNFQATNESFHVNKLRIRQDNGNLFNRSVDLGTIRYQNEAGEEIVAEVVQLFGNMDFDITSNPLFIPVNSSRIVEVTFSVPIINQTYEAYTGDVINAKFDYDDNFEAHGESGSIFTATSNNWNIYGNDMIVHGNVPTITPDTETSTIFFNGPAELYRWRVEAAEANTSIGYKKQGFKLNLLDDIPTGNLLRLSNFQIYEGNSYEDATLLIAGSSGADSYQIFHGNYPGTELTALTDYLYYDESISIHDIFLVFNDDRLIPAGTSKYYILKAAADNVNTGAGSCDQIATYMYDGDTDYLPPMYLEPSCEGEDMDLGPGQYCLSSDGENDGTGAYMIWSDMTGTDGNNFHTDTNDDGWLSSMDWFNGHLINQLDVVRILSCSGADLRGDLNNDGMINIVDIVQLISWIFNLPTEYQLLLADMNEDGTLNIVDVVLLVDAILQLDLGRSLPSQATISVDNNQFKIEADGDIAGFQFKVSEDFQINQIFLPHGWMFEKNGNTILAISADGSELPNIIFEYTGNLN
ncbi:hypothetical protein HOC73_03205, partial [bacterium]|nr:hypothetical protein [bacterium]